MDNLYRCKFIIPCGESDFVEVEEFSAPSDVLAKLEADKRFDDKRANHGTSVEFVFLYNISREQARESEDSAMGHPYSPSNLRGRASGDVPSFLC